MYADIKFKVLLIEMSESSRARASYSLKVILIAAIIAVFFGCLYALYFEDVKQYITIQSSGATKLDRTSVPGGSTQIGRFTIPLVDETDIAYARLLIPEEDLDDIARNISDKKFISDPNSPIQKEILLASSDNNYGADMPWDRDVKPCEVLRNTDQDLYADVQDAKHITIF
jgi:hypothetical protein